MKCFLINLNFFLTLSVCSAQHPNILISTSTNPNEPSIMLDPLNTNRMVAGSNIANVYYSTDAGQTWSEIIQTSSFGVWGDPVFVVDTAGDFYHFHLSNPSFGNWIDRIVCQKSTDGGVTWNDGSFTGLNGTAAQDKEWVAIDRNTNTLYMTWTHFDAYGTSDPQDSSLILFSKSTDAGMSWSNPITISDGAGDCVDSDNTMEGAVPTIGPNGEVYVSWIGKDTLFFDKSTDGGTTWLPNDIVVTNIPGGWNYTIPGLYRCNGLPVTICDTASSSAYNGNIYINWTDQRNGLTDTDVWLIKSTDGGTTWSSPTRVNDDVAGKHQFLTWMTVDQANGNLWFVFYDRRNYSNSLTDVYMARSTDGGTTFENFKVSESPFLPTSGVFFGDYTNIAAYNNVVRPIWARLETGVLSVYTALVDPLVLGNETLDDDDDVYNYPNPFTQETYFSFKLRYKMNVSAILYNQLGRVAATIIDNEEMDYGHHVIKFNATEYNLSPGIYTYVLSKGNTIVSRKILHVN